MDLPQAALHYVFIFIELGRRRVHLAGGTAQPIAAWVIPQARQLTWTRPDKQVPSRFLIRDREATFTPGVDAVFAAEGVGIIHRPYRVPKAKALAERWLRRARGHVSTGGGSGTKHTGDE
jgi:hypothetical protein